MKIGEGAFLFKFYSAEAGSRESFAGLNGAKDSESVGGQRPLRLPARVA
jgi:hypothetical protein